MGLSGEVNVRAFTLAAPRRYLQWKLCIAFFARNVNWGEAIAKLRHLHDGPSKFLLNYIENFPDRRPPDGWDGVMRMDSK